MVQVPIRSAALRALTRLARRLPMKYITSIARGAFKDVSRREKIKKAEREKPSSRSRAHFIVLDPSKGP